MTFKEALNLTPEMNYEEQYEKIIMALGYENVKKCIPFSLEQIKKALLKDEYLNNLPMKKWDIESGFIYKHGDCVFVGSPLVKLYHKIGVNAFSNSEGVAILKQCARMWAAEKQKEMKR